jgi:hypothetical protein
LVLSEVVVVDDDDDDDTAVLLLELLMCANGNDGNDEGDDNDKDKDKEGKVIIVVSFRIVAFVVRCDSIVVLMLALEIRDSCVILEVVIVKGTTFVVGFDPTNLATILSNDDDDASSETYPPSSLRS